MTELHDVETIERADMFTLTRRAVPTGWHYTRLPWLSDLPTCETFVPDPGAPHVLALAKKRKGASE